MDNIINDYLDTSSKMLGLLEAYTKIRLILKDMGYKEHEINKITRVGPELMNAHRDFKLMYDDLVHTLNSLFSLEPGSVMSYLQPRLEKINELIKLD